MARKKKARPEAPASSPPASAPPPVADQAPPPTTQRVAPTEEISDWCRQVDAKAPPPPAPPPPPPPQTKPPSPGPPPQAEAPSSTPDLPTPKKGRKSRALAQPEPSAPPVSPPPPPQVPEQDPLERLRALASTPEEDHQNRRNTDRVPFKIKVEYVSGGTTVTEEAQDVSLKGMFIRTDTPLSVGDPLVVSLSLPESTATLTLPTRVKWVSAFGSLEHPRPGMGVEFTGLDDRRRRALETLLKPASKPPEDSDHYQP